MPGFNTLGPRQEPEFDVVKLSQEERNLTWEQKVLRALAAQNELLERLVNAVEKKAHQPAPQPKGKR